MHGGEGSFDGIGEDGDVDGYALQGSLDIGIEAEEFHGESYDECEDKGKVPCEPVMYSTAEILEMEFHNSIITSSISSVITLGTLTL
ncbi:hypothetical protein HN51_066580 [Arachis hypogaea]